MPPESKTRGEQEVKDPCKQGKADAQFDTTEFVLAPGQTLLVYSDGLETTFPRPADGSARREHLRLSARALEEKFADLEMNLVDLRLTGTGQDGVRFGSKLLSKFGHLASGLASGDFRPTDQQVEVQEVLEAALQTHLQALDVLVATDLRALKDRLRAGNVPYVSDRP